MGLDVVIVSQEMSQRKTKQTVFSFVEIAKKDLM